MKHLYEIAVLPGDGIGVEVMQACLNLLQHLQNQTSDFRLNLKQYPAGAAAPAGYCLRFKRKSLVWFCKCCSKFKHACITSTPIPSPGKTAISYKCFI